MPRPSQEAAPRPSQEAAPAQRPSQEAAPAQRPSQEEALDAGGGATTLTGGGATTFAGGGATTFAGGGATTFAGGAATTFGEGGAATGGGAVATVTGDPTTSSQRLASDAPSSSTRTRANSSMPSGRISDGESAAKSRVHSSGLSLRMRPQYARVQASATRRERLDASSSSERTTASRQVGSRNIGTTQCSATKLYRSVGKRLSARLNTSAQRATMSTCGDDGAFSCPAQPSNNIATSGHELCMPTLYQHPLQSSRGKAYRGTPASLTTGPARDLLQIQARV